MQLVNEVQGSTLQAKTDMSLKNFNNLILKHGHRVQQHQANLAVKLVEKSLTSMPICSVYVCNAAMPLTTFSCVTSTPLGAPVVPLHGSRQCLGL